MAFDQFCKHHMGCCITPPEVAEEVPEFVLTRPAVEVGDSEVTKNQLKLMDEARDIGFLVRASRSLIWVNDKFQKSDGKKAEAGQLIKPAHEEDVLSIVGAFPKSRLRFLIFWEDGKPGGGMVWDPIGRHEFAQYDYGNDRMNWDYNQITEDNSQNERVHIKFWNVKGQTELAAWLDEWRKLIKGESRAEEKARIAAEKTEATWLRKRAQQTKIYQKYLQDEGIPYDESDFE